jgi:ABC-2 type transport system ATP-binding protein
MSEASAVLQVERLVKSFGGKRVIDDVSFSVGKGEVVGLLGPNGAGKSTTILMLLGLISPDEGSVRFFDQDLKKHREEILQRVNFCASFLTFPGRLTAFENLMIFARLYNVPRPAQKVMELLSLFEIEAFKNVPVVLLSSGQSTRVGLCKAFLNDPKVLFLDETVSFLDPDVSEKVKSAFVQLRERHQTAILYTSHNMAEVEQACSRVVFLSRGRIVSMGTPMEVTQSVLGRDRIKPALREVFSRVNGSRA